MAEEDVRNVQAAYQAFGSGDLQGAAENFSDDVEWWSSEEVPEGGTISGKDAVIQSWSNIPNYYTEFSVEPKEFLDAGQAVVVVGTQRGTAKDGGKSFEARFVHVLWSDGGKVSRAEFHSDSAKEVQALNG